MTSRTIVLALHITGVAAWLGANFVQAVLTPRFAKERADIAAAWTRQTIWLGERYYTAVGALIGITGVILVLDNDWDWSDKFIWVGVTVIVIGAVLGVAVFGPLAKQRVAALEAGDEAAAGATVGKIIPFAILDTVLVLLAVVAMVHKWGA